MSHQRINTGLKHFWMIHNMTCLYSEELLLPRPTPKLEDHPLPAARDFLFNTFAIIIFSNRPYSYSVLMELCNCEAFLHFLLPSCFVFYHNSDLLLIFQMCTHHTAHCWMTHHMLRTTISCSFSSPVPNSASVFRDIYTKYNFMTPTTDDLTSHHLQTWSTIHSREHRDPHNISTVDKWWKQNCNWVKRSEMQSDYAVSGVLLTLAVRCYHSVQQICFNTCSVNSTLVREGSNTVTLHLARKLVLLWERVYIGHQI